MAIKATSDPRSMMKTVFGLARSWPRQMGTMKGTIMSISKFCNREVVCAGRDTTVIEAAALMREHHVGDVIVVDQVDGPRTPVGS